jgi:hypothetical protein
MTAIHAGIVRNMYPEIETDAVIAAVAFLKRDKWIQR